MKAQKIRISLMMAVIVFAAAILGVLLGAGLYAATSDDAEAAALSGECADTEITITVENPLYAGVAPSSDARLMSSGAARLSAGGTLYSEHHTETYNSSADTVAAEIRAGMVARNETITVTFETSSPLADGALSDFVDEALEETGEGSEGDYLRWGYSEYSCSGSYSSNGSKYKYVLTYTFSYYTNASEEAAVTKKISQVLSGFGFTSSTTDYEKISAIYDYICENVTYDYDGLNNDSDVLKYTAYGALIEGSAVCQGYSTLFYRMLMESGISSRVIAGVSYGDNHAWNIALLGGYYYNLDSTWDAGVSSYKYFLKCDANFSNHTRNSEYLTSAFYSLYPMATSDYSSTSGGTTTNTTYTVTFNSNGGSSVSSQTVKSGSTATEPTSPTRSGYTFDGWYTSSSGGSKYSFSTAVTSDLTLYAHWTANTVVTYTVTFDSNGGSSVSSQTVNSGSTATQPTSPTKTGYTFDGWYTSSSGGSKYSFSTAVTSNLTLYAHWTINTYTVTFNSNGGSSVTSQTVNYGSTATQPTSPTRSGYTFDGWYTSSSGGSKYSFSTAVTSNLTLYAHWTASSGGTSTTTSSTDTTTEAPDETTTAAPDETTTAAPDETTTAAPDETTAEPDVTTGEGENTT
ncbi:MAG: InlB B-repeat-containing protein, partial [Firmicutes bacterium]|nr:InlB B-repeat-containing protein [Bacillota bacterium]